MGRRRYFEGHRVVHVTFNLSENMIFYEAGAKLADILSINFAKPSFVVIQSFAKSLLVW